MNAMRYATALALPLLLAACAQDEPAPADPGVDEPSGASVPEASPSMVPPAPGPGIAPAEIIPAAMQGRWGMTANDCDPARPDNKGLMVVGANALQFYESRGTVGQVIASDANKRTLAVAYTGEGMEWETQEVLSLAAGGQTLTRQQRDENGTHGPFTYRRCL